MKQPHKHAELIKAWADGNEIQYFNNIFTDARWEDCRDNLPKWDPDIQYRIKPEPSDLGKYGVEVGDVWLLDDKTKLFVFGIASKVAQVQELNSTFHLPYNVNIATRFETLLFRRGVVNKL